MTSECEGNAGFEVKWRTTSLGVIPKHNTSFDEMHVDDCASLHTVWLAKQVANIPA